MNLYRALSLCEAKAKKEAEHAKEMLELETDFANCERERFYSWSHERWVKYHEKELAEAKNAQKWLRMQIMRIDPD